MNIFSKLMPTGITIREDEEIESITKYCCIEVIFQTTGYKVVEKAPGKFERIQFVEKPLHVGAATYDPRYTSEQEIIQRVTEEYPNSLYYRDILKQYSDRYVDYVNVYVLAKNDIKIKTIYHGTFDYSR